MSESEKTLMATRIKELRLKNNMSQTDLANKLGLQKSAIAKYENGRVVNIKRSVIGKMAEIFNCSPTYIMGLDTDSTQNSKPNLVDLFAGIDEKIADQKRINSKEVKMKSETQKQIVVGKTILYDEELNYIFETISKDLAKKEAVYRMLTALDNNILLAANPDGFENASEEDKISDIELLKKNAKSKKSDN